AGQCGGVPPLLGAGDLAGVPGPGGVVGAGLCALAADLGRDRVSLSHRSRVAPRPAPVRAARRHPEPGGPTTGRRARRHRRRARARPERLSRGHERKQLLSVYRLEEMSTPALDALDRERTVAVLTVSPLEEHGPHLPVGVDAFAARHFAETIAERLS